MKDNEEGWTRELHRRIAVYDEMDAKENWQGRMGVGDYVGLLGLTLVLVVGFWAWGV